jgi:rhodanese-related sulfurtransferase
MQALPLRMQKMLLPFLFLFGMAFAAHAQGTDKAYQAKLASLYKGTVATVLPSDLAKYMASHEAPLILDTRSPREFEVSHLPNALFVDYKEFSEEDVAGFDRKRAVVVYCTVGYRSERIGEQLKEMGFQTVFNLYGGIFEWVNQGHEVVDAKGKPTKQVHAYSEDWGQWLQKGIKVY